jgi:hypothetical protein
MKLPGFSAEAAVRTRAGETWSARAITGEVAAGVVPARPCCSACDSVCDSDPESPWCNRCYANCLDC